jgi:hypothetical protein
MHMHLLQSYYIPVRIISCGIGSLEGINSSLLVVLISLLITRHEVRECPHVGYEIYLRRGSALNCEKEMGGFLPSYGIEQRLRCMEYIPG